LDATLNVCQKFMTTIDSVMQLRTEDRTEEQKQELVHAYGGLKVALHLIHPLISSKPLFESGQTLLLITRDKKDTDPGYFEPHNFLVKLRLAALPVLRALWEAPWLISAPLSVSRSIVQTVLELTNGEGEELKGETPGDGGPGIPRPLGADEGRIRQLTDMGFPRSAAERALARTQNNLSAATEILLSHPFPLPPDPIPGPETVESAEPADNIPADPIETDSAEEPIAVDEVVGASQEAEVVPPEPSGKSNEQWQTALDEAREPLRAGISRQALLLVDEHLSLIFHLHVAFIRPTNAHQQQAVRDLVDDIKDFSPFAYDVQEQPLANRCRLLALVLCETPSSLSPELRATLMDSLLALLLSNPVSIDPEHPSIPRWLAAHLLVTEALFTLADEPRAITLPKEDEPIVTESIPTGPPLSEARTIVFDFCLRLLAIPDLPNDELLSTLRLFVLLTRDHESASQFVKRDGLTMLFRRLRASAVPGSSSYIATILRHIVEDAGTVQSIMKQAIKRYFSQPRTNVVDAATFVRNCSAMALRDSRMFIDVTESVCQLVSPFSPSQNLKLKDQSGEKPSTETAPEAIVEMQVDASTNFAASGSESLEGVVHFLIAELMRSTKPDSTTAIDAISSDPVPPAGSTAADTGSAGAQVDSAADPASKDRYQYSCFLMQCLTELLFSYDSCKLAFLSYSSKKKSQTPSKEIPGKFRSTTLHFLLSDLISFETINPQPNSDGRDRITVCNWAMSLLVALCVDTSSTHELKEVSPELVSVRKFVLEAISRAIKDLSTSESLEARYGRLLALADLCHRLLTVRFNTSSRKHQDDTPTHIAKVMLEKNFVATLTTALSEVDLNYPNVRGLVASILRPLEYL
jgi:E3 ubiquitin-protein ligase HUWE1